jgi:predicted DCC family thiol-disulfide oxidoreductase YuxK
VPRHSSTSGANISRLQSMLPELDGETAGVILFDGQCRFCRRVVGWLLRSLSERNLRICSTRSARGSAICGAMGQSPADTFAFVALQGVTVGVDAYVELLRLQPRTRILSGLIKLAPACLSFSVYGWISRHRSQMSRVFVRRSPALPPERFIEGGAD